VKEAAKMERRNEEQEKEARDFIVSLGIYHQSLLTA
jgi:hypothetical protein